MFCHQLFNIVNPQAKRKTAKHPSNGIFRRFVANTEFYEGR